MARIIPFDKNRPAGFILATLPMPDGTRRRYREPNSRNANNLIIAHWKEMAGERGDGGNAPHPR